MLRGESEGRPGCLCLLFFFGQIVGIDGVSEYEKALVKEFRDEIQTHVDGGDQVFVPAAAVGKIALEQGAQGSEDQIIGEHQRHGTGHIGGRMEGITPIEGEVPQHAQHQSDQIAYPVGQMEELIEQGKGPDLDDARRGGDQGVFDSADQFFFHYRLPFCVYGRWDYSTSGGKRKARVYLP